MDLDTKYVIQKMGQLYSTSPLLTILELFPLLFRDSMAVVQRILSSIWVDAGFDFLQGWCMEVLWAMGLRVNRFVGCDVL